MALFKDALAGTIFSRTPSYFALGSDPDDTLSLSRAWDWAQTNGGMIVPDKRKYFVSAPLPTLTDPMTFRGNGSLKTWFVVSPSMSGSLITTKDSLFGATGGSDWTSNQDTINPDTEATGISLRGFSIVGDRSTANQQDGIVHIDTIDNLDMDDVKVFCMKGIGWGFRNGPRSNAMIRESNLGHIYVRRCGWQAQDVPAIHFLATGSASQDASNQVHIQKLDSIWPDGEAMRFENAHAAKETRYINVHGGFIHGREDTTSNPQTKPLFRSVGRNHNCDFSNFEINGVRDGQWAVVIEQHPTTLGSSSACRFNGYIGSGSGTGNGIWMKHGSNWDIDMRDITGVLKHIKLDATVAGPVYLEAYGKDTSWVIDTPDAPTLAKLRKWTSAAS